MGNIGDFSVVDRALGLARETQEERSETAREVDEEKRAPITTKYPLWSENPSEYDFPGIDTPSENPSVLPKDYKKSGRDNFDLTAKAQAKSERGKVPSEERNTTAPVTETSELAATDISLAPEEAFEGVGSGFLFGERDRIDQEQKPPQQVLEKQQQGGNTELYEFPPWTLSRLMTILNDKVYGNDTRNAAKYSQMRQKVQRAQRGMGRGVPFTKDEYNTAKRLLRDAKEEANERAGRMEANIFGDTDEQAEIADKAFQGLINNPPSFD